MIQNERTIDEMQAVPGTYRLIVYEQLCLQPVQVTRELFRFASLEWNTQTEEFLQDCENARDEQKGYFQVVRNPVSAAFRWKDELERKQISRIMDFVADPVPGRIFHDLEPPAMDGKPAASPR